MKLHKPIVFFTEGKHTFMKEIRILTFWNIPNYGCFMQAYALQKTLEKRYSECDVKHLAYLNKKHYRFYYSVINFNYKLCLINPKFYYRLLHNIKHRKDIKATKKFLEYYETIPHTNVLSKKNILQMNFDTLVLGSDIIWDFNMSIFGNDKFLFGNGINAKKKISYAPSFGTVKEDESLPTYVTEGLKKLKSISVRDNNSKKIIKKNLQKEVTQVLDPTLLWNFSEDGNVIIPKEGCNYIVVYGSYFNEYLIAEAKDYCKNHDLKLICVSTLDDKFDWCDITINQDELNPFEWAGYFKCATAVMTCTYHGLIFSLIFKKRIIFNPTEFIMQKASFLITELKLEDVLVNYKSFDKKIEWNWDYKVLDERINCLRNNSLHYLDEEILYE